ncbi:putative glycosyltransferase [Methanocella paludicola SANAE]|uniref:Glycosyltransferase n=1 Tax=Methanocella paludicola (strain DSM 17711 / JCM 13418 / NBRC 101707 / SANAE) TaxID=304371 RepID=D1YZX7_METPS|nr:glycosyltransferase family 2 protein [Methanocella paludicola]BAI61999.1 putative glycosyltransferase [Methanocella paludicola SANAE]
MASTIEHSYNLIKPNAIDSIAQNNSNTPTNEKYRIIVAIPCYNEEIAIGSIVLRSQKFANQVLVIDDGSKDKTSEIARIAGAEIITHKTNQGKGVAIKDAFEFVKRANADILILIDGDGQHNPDEIPLLLGPIISGKADIVNGSRFLIKNGNKVPGYRRIGQEVLTAATNTGTKQKITDSQNGFRAFSSKTFNCFSFRQNGMAIESEMLIDAAQAGLKVLEVPINVRYDVEGSTMNPVSHGFGVLNPIIGLISQERPLLFFGVPGGLLLVTAAIFCFMVLDIFNATKVVAVGYSLIFMLCTILGIFSIFTGLMLWSIQNVRIKIR